MFTGIVEEVGRVISFKPGKLTVAASKALKEMDIGGSIGVNGACLTITEIGIGSFSVDIMEETLKRTNLGQLHTGDIVNLERPLALGGRLGGHLVEGHVDGVGKLTSAIQGGEAIILKLESATELMHYIVEKGFIAVDGVSLTVVDRDSHSFRVSVVDYTREHTNLGGRQIGDLVNLEVDIIAKYVEQFSRTRSAGITVDFLQEHGFPVS
jgi:riboflavin synthase